MNPFKKSSSAPAAVSGTPTNTRGARAQATGATAQGEAAAAPGRGQAETGNQDGARDGPTPPGRAQAPAEEEGHEGKLISNKIRTSLVGRNSVKISKTVPEDFPGSDPDFSSDPDQKSPSGMGGPALAKDRSDLGGFTDQTRISRARRWNSQSNGTGLKIPDTNPFYCKNPLAPLTFPFRIRTGFRSLETNLSTWPGWAPDLSRILSQIFVQILSRPQ